MAKKATLDEKQSFRYAEKIDSVVTLSGNSGKAAVPKKFIGHKAIVLILPKK